MSNQNQIKKKTQDLKTVKEIEKIEPIKPSFFGYRVPKWANDFEYIRKNKGKGDPSDSKTWTLFMVDRLLKKHSV